VQERDETADARNLDRMLRQVAGLAMKHGDTKHPDFLVLRDGRRNPGETLHGYRNALSPRLSLVDVSKRVNAYAYSASTLAPAMAGDVLFMGTQGTPLAVTAPAVTKMQIPTMRKIRIDSSWDGLGLGAAKVAEIVCGSSYSPALGLKPHGNPGPIYWADGAASVSPDNCHFRGIPLIRRDLNNQLLKSK
jgi:hypothetical protein